MTWLLNLPPEASSIAARIDALHFAVILVTFAGVAVTALATAYFTLGRRRHAPRLVAPAWLELGIGAGLLALFLTWWIIGFCQYRELEAPPAGARTVYVTAKQWMWKFTDATTGLASTDVLVVPAHEPVRVVLQSEDVIHSFYVPAFRIKQDVVPGRVLTAWFEATEPGTYDILCAQYCGARHSLMRGQVVVLAAADYARWADARDPATRLPGAKGDGSGLAERGRDVAAARGCLRCHSVDGTVSIGPTWRGDFGSTRALADGSRVVVDEAYVTESMMEPRAKLAAGYLPVMPAYQGVLPPADVDAILEYIRSLR